MKIGKLRVYNLLFDTTNLARITRVRIAVILGLLCTKQSLRDTNFGKKKKKNDCTPLLSPTSINSSLSTAERNPSRLAEGAQSRVFASFLCRIHSLSVSPGSLESGTREESRSARNKNRRRSKERKFTGKIRKSRVRG